METHNDWDEVCRNQLGANHQFHSRTIIFSLVVLKIKIKYISQVVLKVLKKYIK